MTRYGYHLVDAAIVSMWPTGRGDVAHTVTAAVPDLGPQLADALGALCENLWDLYTDPSAPTPEGEPGALEYYPTEVHKVLASPSPLRFHLPIVERANRLGWILAEIDDPRTTASVTAEVDAELDAIRCADGGNLTGRAAQAATKTRLSPIPSQVTAASAAIRENPQHRDRVHGAFDPTSAALAAAEWLYFAAITVGEIVDSLPEEVIVESDHIEAAPFETPTFVLNEMLVEGRSADDVITGLVRDAYTVGRGYRQDVFALLDDITDALRGANRGRFQVGRFKLCVLDPTRPAVDLLDDLLAGINACFVLNDEYAAYDYSDGEDGHMQRQRDEASAQFWARVQMAAEVTDLP